jgi:D-lactate dehydrogenase
MSPLIRAVPRNVPERRVITDNLRRLAYDTDASFWRTIPKVVGGVESED